MSAPVCHRCGGCCQAHAGMLAQPADILRWRREERHDILRVIAAAETIDSSGGLGDTAFLAACPFLLRNDDRHTCAIYAARPQTCREFQPSSRLCRSAREE